MVVLGILDLYYKSMIHNAKTILATSDLTPMVMSQNVIMLLFAVALNVHFPLHTRSIQDDLGYFTSVYPVDMVDYKQNTLLK